MNANKKLFLSAVSSEFESYRQLLADDSSELVVSFTDCTACL
jgi:hypothetical protein